MLIFHTDLFVESCVWRHELCIFRRGSCSESHAFFITEGFYVSLKFGEHLRFLRTSRTDMNQADVAKLLNIDRSTYTNYELGKTEPPLETLKKIAGIFGVSVDRLVFWEHNKFIQ